MVKRGIQKRGLDLIFGEADPRKQPDKVIQVKEPVVLYARDDLNPASQNFTKYPNELHPVMRDDLKGEEAAAIVFVYLWRISFGFGRNYCRVSLQAIERETVIGSRKTVQRAINRLGAVKFIVKGRLKSGRQDKTQAGCLYRVLTPGEIANKTTEEGVVFADIPEKGVVILTPPKMTPPRNHNNDNGLTGSDKLGPPKMTPGRNDTTQNDITNSDKLGGDKMTLPLERRTNKQSDRWGQSGPTQNDTPFKEDSLKDSLSPDHIIDLFYTGIGQKRISRQKREKGIKVIQELQTEGFSLDNIRFAAEWIPGNAKEKPYDFSIMTHMIGQALAAKPALEATWKADAESEVARQEEERRKVEIDAMKAALTEEERAELRARAETEIRESGEFKEAFISKPLIEAKISEIILRE